MGDELYGIVSLLDDQHQESIWQLWEKLEDEFGLSVRNTHVPHFSYHVAKRYAARAIDDALDRLAATTPPIDTRTQLLGVFDAPPPLFFLPLVRTDELSALHRRLWRDLDPIATGVMDRYEPSAWMATVNLAPDIERDLSPKLLPFLLRQNLAWDIRLDNIWLLHDTGARQELVSEFKLRG